MALPQQMSMTTENNEPRCYPLSMLDKPSTLHRYRTRQPLSCEENRDCVSWDSTLYIPQSRRDGATCRHSGVLVASIAFGLLLVRFSVSFLSLFVVRVAVAMALAGS